MYFSKTTIISFGLLATTKLVAGHAAIIGATGDAGGAGSAIGGMSRSLYFLRFFQLRVLEHKSSLHCPVLNHDLTLSS
jgi:hypothetical protein